MRKDSKHVHKHSHGAAFGEGMLVVNPMGIRRVSSGRDTCRVHLDCLPDSMLSATRDALYLPFRTVGRVSDGLTVRMRVNSKRCLYEINESLAGNTQSFGHG